MNTHHVLLLLALLIPLPFGTFLVIWKVCFPRH